MAADLQLTKFLAEIKEVSSKKTASLDVSYKVVLMTDDPSCIGLALYKADSLVEVEIKPEQAA